MKCGVFLRGINLGKRRPKMTELVQILQQAGYQNVKTLLASGNVVLETNKTDPEEVENHIEQTLKQALGYEVATFVRSHEELAKLPIFTEEWTSIHILFFKQSLTEGQQEKLLSLQTDNDTFKILGRDAFWLCKTRISESALFDVSLHKLIAPNTARNQNTLQKMVALTQ